MVDRDALFKDLNDGVVSERFTAFRINLEKNIPLLRRFGGLARIVPRLENRHVVVIAAGPSLEKAFPVLRSLQGRDDMVLLAADMSLRPLLHMGIKPHYVISCETTPVDFFGGIPTEDVHLLAFSCMRHSTLLRWKGDISFYNWMIDTPPYPELWDRAGRGLGSVATGNTVTTQAVAIALGCGIRSLALAGNDMAFRCRMYSTGALPLVRAGYGVDRFHPLSAYEMNASRRRREYEIHRAGQVYYTDSQFLAAKMWLEELLAGQDVPVFDLSIPGCNSKVVRHVDPVMYPEIISGLTDLRLKGTP